jgi:hypothetical protein
MERYLTVQKRILAMLLAVLLCVAAVGCTKIPRSEQGFESGTSTAAQTETDRGSDNETEPSGGAETDENGFPNEPEDGHTKRY